MQDNIFVDFSKVIYLFVYRIIYNILRLFIKQVPEQVTVFAIHNNNVRNYLALYSQEPPLIFTKNKHFATFIKKKYGFISTDFTIVTTFQQVIAILKSEKIILDDYYPASYIIDERKEVWNIWHAYSVYKKVGFDSPVYNRRSTLAKKRFAQNFKRYNKIFVRSEVEKVIFKSAYQITDDTIIIIKPDLFHSYFIRNRKTKKEKNLVVYAPTFRPYNYDYQKVYEHLVEFFPESNVVASYHPQTIKMEKTQLENTSNLATDELVAKAQVIISDYSSLLIEAHELLPGAKLFQVVDLIDYEYYKKTQGINDYSYAVDINKLFV